FRIFLIEIAAGTTPITGTASETPTLALAPSVAWATPVALAVSASASVAGLRIFLIEIAAGTAPVTGTASETRTLALAPSVAWATPVALAISATASPAVAGLRICLIEIAAGTAPITGTASETRPLALAPSVAWATSTFKIGLLILGRRRGFHVLFRLWSLGGLLDILEHSLWVSWRLLLLRKRGQRSHSKRCNQYQRRNREPFYCQHGEPPFRRPLGLHALKGCAYSCFTC
ncbi:MAG: hypothetical protein R6V12_16800, partial [Candidatus Hydrogenedentota bacterium]